MSVTEIKATRASKSCSYNLSGKHCQRTNGIFWHFMKETVYTPMTFPTFRLQKTEERD